MNTDDLAALLSRSKPPRPDDRLKARILDAAYSAAAERESAEARSSRLWIWATAICAMIVGLALTVGRDDSPAMEGADIPELSFRVDASGERYRPTLAQSSDESGLWSGSPRGRE